MISAGKIGDDKERVVRRFSQVQFDKRVWVSSYASAISCQSLTGVQTHHLLLSFSLTFIVPCLNVNYIFHICYTVLPGSLTACAELTTVTFPRYYRLASSFLPSWLWDTGTQKVQVWANYSQTHDNLCFSLFGSNDLTGDVEIKTTWILMCVIGPASPSRLWLWSKQDSSLTCVIGQWVASLLN